MASYQNTTRLVVALGASNTAGYGVGAEYAYPKCIERLLRKRQIAAEVINSGVSGNTTGEMLARLDRDVPAGTCVVLFQPGSNDERRGIPVAVRERNIATITERLRQRGIVVIRVAAAFETARLGNLQLDGIHYTKTGHALIARLLVDEVATALDSGPLPGSRSYKFHSWGASRRNVRETSPPSHVRQADMHPTNPDWDAQFYARDRT